MSPHDLKGLHVYVSGPYSSGPTENVRNAIDAAEALLRAGAFPFVPHLNHHWDALYPHSHDEWMRLCLAWVPRCGLLVRLPGASSGADKEVELAQRCQIAVYDSPAPPSIALCEDVYGWFSTWRKIK